MKTLKDNEISTNNQGTLKTEKGFVLARGTDGEFMGYAKDKEGNRYKIVVASCSLPNCYCWATAIALN